VLIFVACAVCTDSAEVADMGRQELPQLIERQTQVDTDALETSRASKYQLSIQIIVNVLLIIGTGLITLVYEVVGCLQCIFSFMNVLTSSFPQSMNSRLVLNLFRSHDTIAMFQWSIALTHFLFTIHECF